MKKWQIQATSVIYPLGVIIIVAFVAYRFCDSITPSEADKQAQHEYILGLQRERLHEEQMLLLAQCVLRWQDTQQTPNELESFKKQILIYDQQWKNVQWNSETPTPEVIPTPEPEPLSKEELAKWLIALEMSSEFFIAISKEVAETSPPGLPDLQEFCQVLGKQIYLSLYTEEQLLVLYRFHRDNPWVVEKNEELWSRVNEAWAISVPKPPAPEKPVGIPFDPELK